MRPAVPQHLAQNRVSKSAVRSAIQELRDVLADGVVTEDVVRANHANTLTWIAAELPDGVVQPLNSDELIKIVKCAAKYRVPLIAFGAGTSLEGHVNAPQGGLSIDFQRMNRILEINQRDSTVRVEAGVRLSQLNAHLEGRSVFFSVDPGAGEATLGGMAATRASGTNTVRYGTMSDNIMSLQAVMTDGSLIETATEARKSAAGYDLTHLLIGSEGTLGLITELTLRLRPVPASIEVLVCGFQTLHDACESVVAALRQGIQPARIELLDSLMVRAVNVHSGSKMKECPTLFVEFHGRDGETEDNVRQFSSVIQAHGVKYSTRATEARARAALWKARHAAFSALKTAWPGKTVLATDVCVPISKLSICLDRAQKDIARLGLTAPIVGHVGDGNFHVLPVFDRADAVQRQAVEELLDCLVATALDLNGTCSGEHGIGQGKIAYLQQQAGASLEVMRKLKQALDPLNIFNPGKIFND